MKNNSFLLYIYNIYISNVLLYLYTNEKIFISVAYIKIAFIFIQMKNNSFFVAAVVLSFVGEAKVHWEETQFNLGKEETKTKHYRNSESYFNNKTFLFGHGKAAVSFNIDLTTRY